MPRSTAKSANPTPPAAKAAKAGEPVPASPPSGATTGGGTDGATAAKAAPVKATAAKAAAKAPPEPAAEPAGDGAIPRPRKTAGKAARPKPPAALTVTLSYTDGEWLVGAVQGSKTLAKPYLIRPAEALKMVSLLDVPGVQEAVEQIVSAERTDAQQHADRLRAELAEIEAKLAELTDLK
jgi:hypothetical protein